MQPWYAEVHKDYPIDQKKEKKKKGKRKKGKGKKKKKKHPTFHEPEAKANWSKNSRKLSTTQKIYQSYK